MNKPWQYWFYNICADGALLVCAWYWSVHGSAAAGNVLVFFVWVATAGGLFSGVVGLLTPDDQLPPCRRPPGFKQYTWLTNILCIVFLVVNGFVWLPACFLVSALVYEAFIGRTKKGA